MPKATLVVLDQCNVRFSGLDPHVRARMNEALKFVVPNAQHMPLVKLGRWDGTVSFCSVGGSTFLNVLDRVLPIITGAGYDIDLEDRRPKYHFTFPEISETLFADRCWPPGHPMAGEPIVLRDYQVGAIKTFTDHLQSVQQIATGAGKCLDFETEIEITVDETTEFGAYLLNTVEYQEITTGAGFDRTSEEQCSGTKLEKSDE